MNLDEEELPPPADPSTIAVVGSGNLGLVYFTGHDHRLTFGELEELHPGLIAAVASHPGVAMLMVRTKDHGAVVLGHDGVRYLDEDRVEGEDPTTLFGPHTIMSLKREDAMTHAPDLLLISQYDPELGEVAAFEELIGSHGGLGGPQTEPFILHPIEWQLDEDVPLGAPAIYRNIRKWLDSIGIKLGKPTAAAAALRRSAAASTPVRARRRRALTVRELGVHPVDGLPENDRGRGGQTGLTRGAERQTGRFRRSPATHPPGRGGAPMAGRRGSGRRSSTGGTGERGGGGGGSPEQRSGNGRIGTALISGNTSTRRQSSTRRSTGSRSSRATSFSARSPKSKRRPSRSAPRCRATAPDSVVITGNQFRWPSCTVPFTIDAALPNQARVTQADRALGSQHGVPLRRDGRRRSDSSRSGRAPAVRRQLVGAAVSSS